uniref:Cupin type-2 domain-containing protein n=1 Tax=Phaeomonas parva TaxID=124430 RepID=A0A6U4LD29_9STRA|mmetsp:Transcript_6903/g.20120  ORF Transcript_6903/g.20120 Transcript_6903/m.20120 type:complete len:193 (+) Transcript_6903:183-761(+)|eukprot:CAMPEP_0118885544 /NCGR_PEP_ID=MMETSP1163-20130328/23976_1 /TAXON_ID=124430 /ORGANISM="Phaeomonas parva, Strain CCMP2877" /LENGTH=192 /DNA_ID=CAMNT_0006823577 /DNA_START=183 /DNA_END=761 /DNA_ORIENTATION=-
MKCRPPKLVHVVFTLMPFLLLIFLLNERRRLYESLPQHEIGEGKANLLPGQHSGYETIRSRLVGAPSSLPWEETSHGGATRKATLIGQGEIPHILAMSVAKVPPGETIPKHAHDSKVEVFHVQAGHGLAHVWPHPKHENDRVERQQMMLEPGETLIVFPKEEHEIVNKGQHVLTLLYYGVAIDKGPKESIMV